MGNLSNYQKAAIHVVLVAIYGAANLAPTQYVKSLQLTLNRVPLGYGKIPEQ